MVFSSQGAGGFVWDMIKLLVKELPHSFPSKWVAAVRRLENRKLGTGTP